MLIRIFIPILVIFFSYVSNATTYYVSETGNDDNIGTMDLPFKTIQAGSDILNPGDSLIILEGTYVEHVLLDRSGTEGAPIFIIGIEGKTIMDGAPLSSPDEGLLEAEGLSYMNIEGIRVINSPKAGIYFYNSNYINILKCQTHNTVSSGIGIWDCSNVVLDSNTVTLACNDGEQECITLSNTSDFIVSNNIVKDGGPGTIGGEGIDLKEGVRNGKVFGNVVSNLVRLGIYVDAWDQHTYNIEVYNNIVFECADGIALASENGGLLEKIEVYNNILYDNEYTGITITNWGEDIPDHPVQDLTIMNNTVYRNGLLWGGGIYCEHTEATGIIVNNLCFDNFLFPISFEYGGAENFTISHNLVWPFIGYHGEEHGSNSVEQDPLFVDAENLDFHLQPSSPAIDKGSSAGAPIIDFENNPRPHNNFVDIGAYEYTGPAGIYETRINGEDHITAYPNPFSERITIVSDGLDTFIVYDMYGRRIAIIPEGQNTWQPGKGVVRGMYIFKAVRSGKIIVVLYRN